MMFGDVEAGERVEGFSRVPVSAPLPVSSLRPSLLSAPLSADNHQRKGSASNDSCFPDAKRTTSSASVFAKASFFATPSVIHGEAPHSDGEAPRQCSQEGRHSRRKYPGQCSHCVSWWSKTLNTLEVVGAVVKKNPTAVLVLPLIALCLLIALGVFGTIQGTQQVIQSQKDVGMAVAMDTSVGLKLMVEQTFAPLIAFNSFLLQTPNITEFQPRFHSIASNLLLALPQNSISELQLSPFGVIVDTAPITDHIGINIFEQPELRPGAIDTLELGQIVLSGPLLLVGGGGLAGIARMPVFVPNVSADESFGSNISVPYGLTLDQVYNASSRTKFWGFVTAIISFEEFLHGTDSRLTVLNEKGYLYKLTRPDTNLSAPEFVIADTAGPDGSGFDGGAVCVEMQMTNSVWTLCLAPNDGWTPSWFYPVLAAVVVMSFIISLMVFVMMISVKQQAWMLTEMLAINQQLAETTRTLEEEKGRMDVMLVRQYNLIQCFQPGNTMGRSFSKEGSTVDRIESMRRQFNTENMRHLAETEQIQTLEVLGEGTFGKVYKGLWRGTEVAVKTMILPANMTGQEKREKMAVMEAAISSSLTHPNVVATYTYSIKPVVDTTNPLAMDELDAGLLMMPGSSFVNDPLQTLPPSDNQTQHSQTHSYEVRLVLEYCDRGSLREALDHGAFLCSSGINYRAVLDTALDIAKAMCHLHAMNVLHSDLKARNVMLKTSGDSRGFVAKVADFGLSVKMDLMQTHVSNVFQGTLTHMAPEILLEGRVSKATDVYAYGITLWELLTGGHAFQGTPRALLGHLITHECKRPCFSSFAPRGFTELAQACWQPDHEARPTFDQVLAVLQRLRAAEDGASEVVPLVLPCHPPSGSQPRGFGAKVQGGLNPLTEEHVVSGRPLSGTWSGWPPEECMAQRLRSRGSMEQRFRPQLWLQPVNEKGESAELLKQWESTEGLRRSGNGTAGPRWSHSGDPAGLIRCSSTGGTRQGGSAEAAGNSEAGVAGPRWSHGGCDPSDRMRCGSTGGTRRGESAEAAGNSKNGVAGPRWSHSGGDPAGMMPCGSTGGTRQGDSAEAANNPGDGATGRHVSHGGEAVWGVWNGDEGSVQEGSPERPWVSGNGADGQHPSCTGGSGGRGWQGSAEEQQVESAEQLSRPDYRAAWQPLSHGEEAAWRGVQGARTGTQLVESAEQLGRPGHGASRQPLSHGEEAAWRGAQGCSAGPQEAAWRGTQGGGTGTQQVESAEWLGKIRSGVVRQWEAHGREAANGTAGRVA